MRLVIDDKHSIECKDGNNYNLIENYFTNPKEGKGKLTSKIIGHYSDPYSALKGYVKKDLEHCLFVNDIITHVNATFEKINKLMNNMENK